MHGQSNPRAVSPMPLTGPGQCGGPSPLRKPWFLQRNILNWPVEIGNTLLCARVWLTLARSPSTPLDPESSGHTRGERRELHLFFSPGGEPQSSGGPGGAAGWELLLGSPPRHRFRTVWRAAQCPLSGRSGTASPAGPLRAGRSGQVTQVHLGDRLPPVAEGAELGAREGGILLLIEEWEHVLHELAQPVVR